MWHTLVEKQINSVVLELQQNKIPFQVILERTSIKTPKPEYHVIIEPEGLPSMKLVTFSDYQARVYKNVDVAITRLMKLCPTLESIHVRTKPNEVCHVSTAINSQP